MLGYPKGIHPDEPVNQALFLFVGPVSQDNLFFRKKIGLHTCDPVRTCGPAVGIDKEKLVKSGSLDTNGLGKFLGVGIGMSVYYLCYVKMLVSSLHFSKYGR